MNPSDFIKESLLSSFQIIHSFSSEYKEMLITKVSLLLVAMVCQVQQPGLDSTPSILHSRLEDGPQQRSILELTERPGVQQPAIIHRWQMDPSMRTAQLPQLKARKVFSILDRSGPNAEPEVRVARVPAILQSSSAQDLVIPPVMRADKFHETMPKVVRHKLNQPTTEQRFHIELTGPDLIEFGKLHKFRIKVSNISPMNSGPVELQLGTPPGIEFVDSSLRGKINDSHQLISWDLESIVPNEPHEIVFRCRGGKAGPQLHQLMIVEDDKIVASESLETFVLKTETIRTRILTSQFTPNPDENFQAHIIITNLTAKSQEQVQAAIDLPENFRAMKSNLYDVIGNQVVFKAVDLEVRQARQLTVALVANRAGLYELKARVASERSKIAGTAQTMMEIGATVSQRFSDVQNANQR